MERMLTRMAEGGVPASTSASTRRTSRAIGFYRRLGFVTLMDVADVCYLGLGLR